MFPWTGLDHQGENVGSIQDGSHIAVADCLGEVTDFGNSSAAAAAAAAVATAAEEG